MYLEGKRIAFLGDSITEGVGVSSKDKRYTDVFAKLTDSVALNYGISGTRIAEQSDKQSDIDFQDFNSRVDCIDSSADVIVVFGGTNDFGHGDAPIGVFSDRTVHSFYGALHVLCQRLISKFPNAEIIFMTPLHRDGEDTLVNNTGLARRRLSEYVDAIKEVCKYYSLPVLDLFANSGIQPCIGVIKEAYMPDGLHPSDKGAERIAHRLKAFLASI